MSKGVYTSGSFVPRSFRHKKRKKKLSVMAVIIISSLITIFVVSIPLISKEMSTSIASQAATKSTASLHVESSLDPNRFHEVMEISDREEQHETAEVELEESEEESQAKEEEQIENIAVQNESVNVEPSEELKWETNMVVIHEVKPNETLSMIVMTYYGHSDLQDKVAEYNGITDPSTEIQAGMKLEIPDPQYMVDHHVVPGESLQAISERYYGTKDYIGALAIHNNLTDANHLPIGKKIHIPNPTMLQKNIAVPKKPEMKQNEEYSMDASFHITVDKQVNKLYVLQGEKTIKTFNVGTGKETATTPEGDFTIVNKLEKPWYRGEIPGGSAENPLGSHWLGLNVPGTDGTIYGIHGTNDSSSVGKHVSLGCIRMNNEDVSWLYEKIPIGTTVTIY